MDAVDFDIVRTMGLRPFSVYPPRAGGLKPGDIAKQLGLRVGLVRERVGKLESAGVLKQYRVFPNLGLFGLRSAAHHFKIPQETKRRLLPNILKVDGVEGFWDYVGDDVLVLMAFPSDADRRRRLDLVGTLLGVAPEPYNTYWCTYPRVTREPSRLDWQILVALLDDARRPMADLASDLRVTPKTVRQRVRRMRADGILDEHVHIELTQAPGVMVFGLAFSFAQGHAGRVVPRVLKAFEDRTLASWKQPEATATGVDIDVYALSMAEVRAMEEKARGIDGVDETTTLVLRGSMYSDAWLQALLAPKVNVG